MASLIVVAMLLRVPSTGEGVDSTEVLIGGIAIARGTGALAGLDGVTDRRWGHAETS